MLRVPPPTACRARLLTGCLLALISAALIPAQTTKDFKPVADAGDPQWVRSVGQTIRLDGSRSLSVGDEALSYQWTLVSTPAGSMATLSNVNDLGPAFTADREGDYVAQLVVSDGAASSEPSRVLISTSRPRPVAIAGEAINASVGRPVTLNGSGSWDAAGRRLRFHWSLTSQPAGSTATLRNSGTPFPSFTPDVPGDYVACLTVATLAERGVRSSESSEASVTRISTLVAAPHAMPNVKSSGGVFTLDGSGSTDPNGLLLRYRWTVVSRPTGSQAQIVSREGVLSSFQPDVAGSYVIGLTVNNGQLRDRKNIVIHNSQTAPITVSAGRHQHVATGDLVQLSSAIRDGSGMPTDQEWSFTFRPAASKATLTQSATSAAAFTVDAPGDYVLQTTVRDGDRVSVATVLVSTDLVFPVAMASVPSASSADATLLLHGDESVDPAGKALEYRWSVLSAPDAAFQLHGPAMRTAVLQTKAKGTYVTQLEVRNERFATLATASALNSIASLSPASGDQGSNQTVTISGSLLGSGLTQVDFGSGITVENLSVANGQAVATIYISNTATFGAHDVALTLPQSGLIVLSGAFTVTPGTLGITAVTPAVGSQGSTMSITISGEMTHFATGTTGSNTTVSLGAGITVNSVSAIDTHTLSVNATIASGATLGGRDVTVTTGGEVAVLKSGFQVKIPGTVTLAPWAIEPNAETDVIFTGVNTNFISGTTVSLPGPITVKSVSVQSATSLIAHIVVPLIATPSALTATITSGPEVDTALFAVATPIAVSPSSGDQGTDFTMTLSTSSQATFGTTVQLLSFGAGNSGITASTTPLSSIRGKSVAQFGVTIADTALKGPRNIMLLVDGTVYTATNKFSVTRGTPSLIAISQPGIHEGQTLTGVEITGEMMTGPFSNVDFGPGITVSNVVPLDNHHLSVTLTASSSAPAGPRSFSLSANGVTATGAANLFQVYPPPVALTPAALELYASHAIVVSGTNTHFVQGQTVANFGAGIAAPTVTVQNSTTAIVTISVAPAAALGSRGITLTTGSETVTGTFTVALPVTFNVHSVPQGTTVSETVTVEDTTVPINLQHISQTAITGPSATNDMGPLSNMISPTLGDPQFTAVFKIGETATPGAYTFSFQNNGYLYLATDQLIVTTGTPQILSITPNQVQQGVTTQIAVKADMANFVPGGISNFDLGPGVTVRSISVVDYATLSVTISVAPDAPIGINYVSLTTPTQRLNLNNGFAVLVGTPSIYSISPAAVNPGMTVTFQITGISSNFDSTTQLWTTCKAQGQVTVTSPTTLTYTTTVPNTPGTCSLTLVTGGHSLYTNYTIYAPLTVTPNSGAAGTSVDVALTGTQFDENYSLDPADFGPGITATPTGISGGRYGDQTTVYYHLVIDPSAARGPRNVSVTTTGYPLGQMQTIGGFTVASASQ